MPSGPLGLMLRRLIGRPRPADLGDDELLQRFVVCHDMGAFEALVQRFGPLVLGVCRRVLQDEHDAEDAFQATFLVFARRAATIHNQGAVGSWLAGTAYRISLKARAAAVRRRVQEREAGTQLPADKETAEAWDEMRLVLDEELNRLPEKYRVPLVLCYLEGKTNEAAARELGWAPGSMSYRLAQAKERLRERLVHRGVGLAPSLLGPALATYALVDVPAALAGATAKAGLLFEAGQRIAGLVSPQAINLAEAALRAFDLIKTLFVALFGLLVAVGIGGTVLFLMHGMGDDGSLAETELEPVIVKALDEENRIALQFSEETQRFGISCLKLPDPRRPGKFKLLTSDERGQNNNTRVLVDGSDYRFGFETPNARWYRDKDKKLWKGVKVGDRKWVSIMEWKQERLRITQSVQIAVGEQTQLYDTALVKYAVQNLDTKPHTVGVRVLLDTYIGGNDGVPFLIPPSPTAPSGRLLDTMAVFEKEQVPPFLRALESTEPNDRHGTVAEMGLKLHGLEPLSKVVICRWPGDQGGGSASWEWPFEPMNADPQNRDSCVVLYWNAMTVQPQDRRTLGFTYGLGRMADTADRAPMRMLVSGSGKVGRAFVLTFYVRGEVGETVRLQLPEGLLLAEGQKLEQVVAPPLERGCSQVSWRVEALKTGRFIVRANLGRHDAKVDIHVRENSIFD
jgi:RNA polymerase sigma factor (sigma-70 family)